MRVVVNCSFPDGKDTWVRFSSSLGEGEARWHGAPPRSGGEYFVELELSPPVEITSAMVSLPLLDARRDQVLARGRVEQVDQDGATVVRLGDPPSAPLVLIGDAQLRQGRWVAIRAAALALHDQNL